MANLLFTWILYFTFLNGAFSWSQVELDLFDLVEEIGENFYDVLKVKQDCSAADIRRAYRKLSLQLHPDKSDDPNAAEIFTKIVAVADVLKDEEKRRMYDSVLEHGLPDWRQPIYYYRRVRKMGVTELAVLLMVIATVGQFLYGWAAYLEKQIVLYELKQKRDEKLRRTKGKKTNQQLEAEVLYYEMLAQACLPHYKKLLPVLLLRKSYHLGKAILFSAYDIVLSRKRRKAREREMKQLMEDEERQREESEKQMKEEQERLRTEEEKAKIKAKKLRKLEQRLKVTKMRNELEERNMEEKRGERKGRGKEEEEEEVGPPWEGDVGIEADVDDSRQDSTSGVKEKKLKKGKRIADLNDLYTTMDRESPSVNDDVTCNEVESDKCSPQFSSEEDLDSGEDWSQYQQKQLEWGLSHYPKDTEGRWDLIARAVPGKSKSDCVDRYKELVRLVKDKKRDNNS